MSEEEALGLQNRIFVSLDLGMKSSSYRSNGPGAAQCCLCGPLKLPSHEFLSLSSLNLSAMNALVFPTYHAMVRPQCCCSLRSFTPRRQRETVPGVPEKCLQVHYPT